MRKGMAGAGFALFLIAGFWSYEFYVLYQDVTTIGGFIDLAFGSHEPLALYIMNALGIQNAPYQTGVMAIEIMLLMCIAFTLAGHVAFVLGASMSPKKN